MPDKTIEINGVEEISTNILRFINGIETQLKLGVDKAMKNTAEDIQVVFKGGASPGFKDRTGALRGSIRGGIDDLNESDDIVGFVGAGDDSIGSNGLPTREYVDFIEFGEFSRAGSTSFLRSGFLKSQSHILNIIKNEVNVESML